jgi:hypothetical protein
MGPRRLTEFRENEQVTGSSEDEASEKGWMSDSNCISLRKFSTASL